MARGYKRRNFFIKKDLQGRFIFRYFLLSLACVLIFSLVFSYLAQDNLTITYHGKHLQIGKTPVVLLQELVAAHWFFLVTVGVMMALISMILTHRIAGPIYRFERTFEAMTQRNLDQKIYLRTKDEAKEAAAMINTFTDMLSGDIRRLKECNERLGDSLEKLAAGSGEREEWLRRAAEEQQSINRLLEEYRLRTG